MTYQEILAARVRRALRAWFEAEMADLDTPLRYEHTQARFEANDAVAELVRLASLPPTT